SFHEDSVSAVHLTLDGSPELTLTEVVAPDDELLARPPDRLKSGDRDRLRSVGASVRAVPSFRAGVVRPALPPDPDPARPAARGPAGPGAAPAGGAGRGAAGSKPVPSYAVGSVRDTPPPDEAEEPPGSRRLLDLLLDTRQGLGVLLLLAAAFGAVHALTPGHG